MKDSKFERYSRQIFIEEIGVEGQRKIEKANVLVIGAGGLGAPAFQYLLAAGVGTLGIIDFDTVELHNLNRQVIHSENSIGSYKVDSARQFADAFNSQVHIIPINDKLDRHNAELIIGQYDIIIDGSDNFGTRYLVNDTCVLLGKPLVYGSIFHFEGQIAVFNYQGSKQLRELFPEQPSAEDIPNCDANGVLGPLPGIIGSMMAMNAIKMITGLPVTTNELLIFDSLAYRLTPIRF